MPLAFTQEDFLVSDYFYRPYPEDGEGNVFTLSVHDRGDTPVSGPMFLLGVEGYRSLWFHVPFGGNRRTGVPSPSQEWVLPLPGLEYLSPPPTLATTGPYTRQVTLRAVRLLRFPTGGLLVFVRGSAIEVCSFQTCLNTKV